MARIRTSLSARRHVISQLEAYFRDVNRTSLLTADEEKSIARRIQAGDMEARNHMVRANLRLAVKIARQFLGRGLGLQDLIQEANLGLLQAANKFDPTMNVRFSTYASFWVLQTIRRALVNTTRPIRLPRYVVDLLSKWQQAATRLEDELGRNPTFEEVSKEMQLSSRRTEILRQAFLISSSSYLDDEDCLASGEMLAEDEKFSPEAQTIERDVLEYVHGLIDKMKTVEKKVLRMRFGLDTGKPQTRKEIGVALGLAEHQVRHIEKDVIQRLAAKWLSREEGSTPPSRLKNRSKELSEV